tara:strand:+ start:8041 stop:8835 length:795 start_codon:yes stop_codon:yes gene_type:complete
MNKNITGLSIVLPTINESENLKKIIPELISNINEIEIKNFEILVVDDGSTDDTFEFMNQLMTSYSNISLMKRENAPSLPMSIWDGLLASKYDYILWMDADGSMPPYVVRKLIVEQNNNPEAVIIGSRFAEGGGYKGIKELGKTGFFEAIKNVYHSNDSVFGMIFSTLFNKLLKSIFKTNLTDITSGFIIGRKSNFTEEQFNKSEYGEYFIYMLSDLIKNKVNIIEIGYICETRISGISKTASNIGQLIRRGIPYIQTALKVRYK